MAGLSKDGPQEQGPPQNDDQGEGEGKGENPGEVLSCVALQLEVLWLRSGGQVCGLFELSRPGWG